ncbi:MAG: hypothetical protein H7330_01120 [Hymenobacteraceae bacterium]|nr:hypothetical protein [Hymenobacteraceae bacterium]
MKYCLKLFALALLLTATACSKTTDKKAPTAKPADATTLQREYSALRDTLDGRWAQMTASDDEKIFFQKRLLDEISYVPSADMGLVKRLQIANNRLKDRRYAQITMASDSIDAYDRAQEAVLLPLRELASKHADPVKRHIIGELVEAILLHDDRVVRYRGTYDQAARAYNLWLQAHQTQLPAAADAKPVPLFSLTGA